MSRGPVLTLVAVVVLGLVLLGANILLRPVAPTSTSADPAAPPPTVAPDVQFVGYASMGEGQVPVAVTVDDGQAKMYVCDGTAVDAWLQGSAPQGSAPQGQFDLGGRHGDRVTGTFSGTGLTGSVHLDGRADAPFTASATKDGRAGIYRNARNGRVSGWVVLGEGSEKLSSSGTGTDDDKNKNSGDDGNSNSNSNSNSNNDKDDGKSRNDDKKSDKNGKNDSGKNDSGKNDSGKNKNGKGDQTGLTRDSSGAVSPAAPLALDGGPLPPGVSKVDATTDVLTGW